MIATPDDALGSLSIAPHPSRPSEASPYAWEQTATLPPSSIAHVTQDLMLLLARLIPSSPNA
ncbi:hypothetical protein XF_0753 [Xylella fastidiosa 9a5c]|uniref:Uncharacterized protein n=1 Tax=Xylella fastidiosa (strain 9a5c) TaxID=160492 RepID=Q9PFC5_XYLFA|nr:hypothetical protein XF_0753 [Xylella fastidiosa 9a5c]